jgi:hypothetical protein
MKMPGGSVDYVLVSALNRKVRDYVGVELQTLDTTGTVWPERQRFLRSVGLRVSKRELRSEKGYGLNWKMTAKTILMQLHHKIKSFEAANKHLVLVLQDRFLDYMQREFSFAHIRGAKTGDPMHFHSYNLRLQDGSYGINLHQRLSTDSAGIAACLGQQPELNPDLQRIVRAIESKLSDETVYSPA